MTVLIDTNVIIDYILNREPFAENARECIEYLIITQKKPWLTASTITDIYYLTRRALKDNSTAKDVVAKLLNAFYIASVDKADCLNTLGLDIDDYEDALLSQCASRLKADCIITRNKNDFINSPIPVLMPQEFIIKHSR